MNRRMGLGGIAGRVSRLVGGLVGLVVSGVTGWTSDISLFSSSCPSGPVPLLVPGPGLLQELGPGLAGRSVLF